MDTFTFRPDRSVFKHIPIEKISPMYTWMTYKNVLGIVRLDPFHIAKYFMMGFFTLACIFAAKYPPPLGWWNLIIYPLCWHVGFESFWGYILYRPNK